MPQFAPSSVHKATATFSNPKSAGFDYSASLCMGAAWTEMASALFHLDAGQSKPIQFSVTMPSAEGTYPVYFKVTSGGVVIGTFVAKEDVTILPTVAKFVYVSAIRHYEQKVSVDPGMGGGTTKYVVFEVDVQNQGGIAALCSAIASVSVLLDGGWPAFGPFRYEQYARNNALALKVASAYINPGQIVTFREATWDWAYEDAKYIKVKFSGDAGEIISEQIKIYLGKIQ